MMKALLMAVLPLGLALVCPTFTCGDLQQDVCAMKVDERTAVLSNLPCSTGKFCSGQRLYEDWLWSSATGIGTGYQCLDAASYEHLSTSYKDNYSRWACYGRQPNKDLAVGIHPKDCASDHDCQLLDGTLSSCQCGLRSSASPTGTSGICVPDFSSSVFNNYWNECDDLGYIDSADVGFYYKVLHDTYAILQNPPVDCASGVVWEFQLLAMALQESLSSGVFLVLAVWTSLY